MALRELTTAIAVTALLPAFPCRGERLQLLDVKRVNAVTRAKDSSIIDIPDAGSWPELTMLDDLTAMHLSCNQVLQQTDITLRSAESLLEELRVGKVSASFNPQVGTQVRNSTSVASFEHGHTLAAVPNVANSFMNMSQWFAGMQHHFQLTEVKLPGRGIAEAFLAHIYAVLPPLVLSICVCLLCGECYFRRKDRKRKAVLMGRSTFNGHSSAPTKEVAFGNITSSLIHAGKLQRGVRTTESYKFGDITRGLAAKLSGAPKTRRSTSYESPTSFAAPSSFAATASFVGPTSHADPDTLDDRGS